MKHSSSAEAETMRYERVVGLDLSDRTGTFVELDPDPREERVRADGTLTLSETGLREQFGGRERCRIVIEVGTHSPWVDRLLRELGHEVVVANPRRVALIYRTHHKTDRVDAENLARLGRVDVALLHPIRHRSAAAQVDLETVRARATLIEMRTQLINHVRGAVKSRGLRVPACAAEAFPHRARLALAGGGATALLQLLVTVATLTRDIKRYDREIVRLARESYPAAPRLQQVPSVGPVTTLTYLLTLDDPRRFRHSREVGPYLGMTRREDRSGDQKPELPISKAGDPYLRQLLVQCAHHLLGRFGRDCDLRRWGLRLAGTGSSQRKKKAIVAVARKLAVLLHHLWVSGEVYQPLRTGSEPEAVA